VDHVDHLRAALYHLGADGQGLRARPEPEPGQRRAGTMRGTPHDAVVTDADRRVHTQASLGISTYLNYFYQFLAVCTNPSGSLTDLTVVQGFFNTTAQIESIKAQFNATVGALNLTQLQPNVNIDFSYGRTSPLHRGCTRAE
jgi:hypothetical protein